MTSKKSAVQSSNLRSYGTVTTRSLSLFLTWTQSSSLCRYTRDIDGTNDATWGWKECAWRKHTAFLKQEDNYTKTISQATLNTNSDRWVILGCTFPALLDDGNDWQSGQYKIETILIWIRGWECICIQFIHIWHRTLSFHCTDCINFKAQVFFLPLVDSPQFPLRLEFLFLGQQDSPVFGDSATEAEDSNICPVCPWAESEDLPAWEMLLQLDTKTKLVYQFLNKS